MVNSKIKEIEVFKEKIINTYLYDKMSINKISKNYGISRGTLSRYFDSWRIKRRKYSERRTYNVSKLLLECPIAYYWIGFLLADGCFSRNYLVMKLSTKDSNQVSRLRKFLENSDKGQQIGCAQPDVLKIKRKFYIVDRKTYNPPNYRKWKFSSNNLLALFIGFIDGDGCIKYNSYKYKLRLGNYLTIELHKTWKNFLVFMWTKLQHILNIKIKSSKPHINIRDFAYFCIGNTKLLRSLKYKAIELCLPVLDRKWNRIDLKNRNQFEKARELNKKILFLQQTGVSCKRIASKLKISTTTVQRHLYKYKFYQEE